MQEEFPADKSKYSDRKPNYFLSMFGLRCPRCRRGPMFKNRVKLAVTKNMEMYRKCPLCGQYNELEVGFYYGTGYVSYALTVALTVATFVAYYVLIGISINDNSLFIWLGVNIAILVVLMPYMMKLSRTIWLWFFVKYDMDWKTKEAERPERIVDEQMGNW
ncbi:MAG: DUF983 domain-containing protein [Chitinophagaceae bacterium]